LTEFAFRTIKLGVIVMLVRTAGDYQTYVVDLFFHSIPNEIGTALNSGATTSASAFDALLDQGQAVAHAILKKASSWSISEAFFSALAWLLVIISSFLVAAIGFIVSLYAKVALALVLALGPAFIALALFDATRRFTEAWIGQLVNYVTRCCHRSPVDHHDRRGLPDGQRLRRFPHDGDVGRRRVDLGGNHFLPTAIDRIGARGWRSVAVLRLQRLA